MARVRALYKRECLDFLVREDGRTWPAAAEYLGHSPTVLLRTYAHSMRGDRARAGSAVQAAFEVQAARVTSVS
jgi:hypothetical protein